MIFTYFNELLITRAFNAIPGPNMEVLGNGSVTRLKCKDPITAQDLANFTDSDGNVINEEARARFYLEKRKRDASHEKATVMLEQDRIFHTCHALPTSIKK